MGTRSSSGGRPCHRHEPRLDATRFGRLHRARVRHGQARPDQGPVRREDGGDDPGRTTARSRGAALFLSSERAYRGPRGRSMSQIYPSSITGKDSGFAEGVSVLDHAFGRSDAYTLGVEEEYMLLDRETFGL